MAIVFDSTVSGTNANSYAPIADYNQYRENQGLSVLATDAAQVALIKSTAWLDAQYRDRWNTQTVAVDGQALHWPQDGAKDYAGNELADDAIPSQVLQAVYEYAIRAENQSTLDPATATNVKVEKMEGLGEFEYFNPSQQGSLPDGFAFIDQILTGLISGKLGGIKFLDASRY